jgi:hypothetical protein
MKNFDEEIHIVIKPKSTDNQSTPLVFDWCIKHIPNTIYNTKDFLMLFQCFILQQATIMLNGNSGLDDKLHCSEPVIKLTQKQIKTINTALVKAHSNVLERFVDEKKLTIKTPQKPNLL